MNIKELTDKIIADGKLTKAEHQQLHEAIKADGKIDEAESAQVTRIMEMISEGKLTVE